MEALFCFRIFTFAKGIKYISNKKKYGKKDEKSRGGGKRMWGRYGDLGCGGMIGYGGFGLGWLFMLIIWVLIIWAIIAIVRAISHHGRGPGIGRGWAMHDMDRDKNHMRDRGMEEDSAMRILRERLAKGEITKEEFDQRKRDLM